MGIEQMQKALLEQHGLRVTSAMSQYILARLRLSASGGIPIIAGDAKTGLPMHKTIAAAELLRFAANPSANDSFAADSSVIGTFVPDTSLTPASDTAASAAAIAP